jgi:hydrogenase maturation protease
MATLKADIAALFARRESLKQEAQQTRAREARRKLWAELENVDARLSELDSRYKRLWDMQQDTPDRSLKRWQVLVLGIGNVLWADEGFGVRCVEALHEQYEFPPAVTLMDGGTQGLYLLQHVQAASHVLIFDAVDYGLPPGTLKTVRDDAVPQFMGAKKMSLHQVGFQETLAAAKLTNKYPDKLTLIGVQPEELDDYGGGLRACVQAQVAPALELGLTELARWGVQAQSREHPGMALSPLQMAA